MSVTEKWQTLYEQHSPALLLYARQWGGSLGDAEDLVHDAFANLIRKRVEPRGAAAYLFAAVRHAAVDRHRSSARRRHREQAATANQDWFERPSETTERHEELEVALRKISQAQREVLVMKIWGELTFEAIGQVLQISSNTAASRYRYAVAAMREILDRRADREMIS